MLFRSFQINTGQAEQLFRYAAEQVCGTDVLELSWVALRLHESPGAAAWQRWWKWVRAKQKFAAR